MRVLSIALLFPIVLAAQGPALWLDRPLSNWNSAGSAMPRPAAYEESIAGIAKRCDLTSKRATPAERSVSDAGWIPFYVFDRQVVQGDVEIIGGLSAADGMCRPVNYNVFVFVRGQFAGTLSPVRMTSRADGAVGAVRLSEEGIIAAEFMRYVERDPLCCPSGRVTLRYHVDKTSTPPLVVPSAMQPTRR